MSAKLSAWIAWAGLLCMTDSVSSHSSAKILYDAIMDKQRYRPSVRPVTNHSEPILLYMNLSLTQILDVDIKNQIVTLNMWVFQEWWDPNFQWVPQHFDNITEVNIPAASIWTPDLVLYNNAGGGDWDFASSGTKIKVRYDGRVFWRPPVIFQSQCEIDVEFFPFDTQICKLKLGTWTHNGLLIDLRHVAQKEEADKNKRLHFDHCEAEISLAIDLYEFVDNVEWDVMDVSAKRNIQKYPCCPEPYLDLTFYVKVRRKTLFYGVNLICPCLAISFLTILVFYLPGHSRQKITLSINILISLTVFFLLIFDICPPTSKVVPLVLKYLLFTMILVTLSVMSTVIILNVHTRSPDTHRMSRWVRHLFTRTLPRLLFMEKPEKRPQKDTSSILKFKDLGIGIAKINVKVKKKTKNILPSPSTDFFKPIEVPLALNTVNSKGKPMSEFDLAVAGVQAIASHMKTEDALQTAKSDWKYVAVVLDRLFLWLFSCAAVIGAFGIFMQAPSISDIEKPLQSGVAYLSSVQRLCKNAKS